MPKGHIVGEYKTSEETKRKISLAHTGIKFSDSRKKNISNALKGRTLTTEWKNKIRNAHIGREFSEEHKRKIGRSGEANGNWKGGCSNREYRNAMLKKWRKNNPLKVKAAYHKRRVLTSDLKITVIQTVYEDNIKQYGTLTCYLCQKPILFGKDHLEHKTPLCRGGSNDYDNLGIACQKCNLKKQTKTYEEYLKIC